MADTSSLLAGKELREFGCPPKLAEKLMRMLNVYAVRDLLDLSPEDVAAFDASPEDKRLLELLIWEAACRE